MDVELPNISREFSPPWGWAVLVMTFESNMLAYLNVANIDSHHVPKMIFLQFETNNDQRDSTRPSTVLNLTLS